MRSKANSNGVNLVSSTAITLIYMISIFSNKTVVVCSEDDT